MKLFSLGLLAPEKYMKALVQTEIGLWYDANLEKKKKRLKLSLIVVIKNAKDWMIDEKKGQMW